MEALYRTTDGVPVEAVLTLPGVFVDMVADETDPDHLFAASWDRTRRAHEFTEGGTGPGLGEHGRRRFVDTHLRTTFPEGPDAGRLIGYHSATGTLFALIDNQSPREAQPSEDEGLTAMDFVEMDKAAFEDLDVDLQAFLDQKV